LVAQGKVGYCNVLEYTRPCLIRPSCLQWKQMAWHEE
jgi:hypothetical protein